MFPSLADPHAHFRGMFYTQLNISTNLNKNMKQCHAANLPNFGPEISEKMIKNLEIFIFLSNFGFFKFWNSFVADKDSS